MAVQSKMDGFEAGPVYFDYSEMRLLNEKMIDFCQEKLNTNLLVCVCE